MPKTPTDYSKTVIYKIQHIDKEDLLYVGSTTDFRRRKAEHKHNCKTKKTKLYEMIRYNGGWNEFNMVVIKNFCCNNGEEAKAEEDRIIREMKCNMNMIRAYISNEEKKELEKEYNKQYQENNKERLKEYDKQYYEQNREEFLERQKKHYEQNKEKIKERQKEYYERNKEKHNKKIICVCGCEIMARNKTAHRRTNKHRKILIRNGINPDELIY